MKLVHSTWGFTVAGETFVGMLDGFRLGCRRMVYGFQGFSWMDKIPPRPPPGGGMEYGVKDARQGHQQWSV